MIQIAYTSNAISSLDAGEVFKIIEISAKNNARDDLTGMLIFSRGRFFQVVEGPEERIEALLSRLNRDQRHSDLNVLSSTKIQQRSFPGWTMKRVTPGTWQSDDDNGNPAIKMMPAHLRPLVDEFLHSSSYVSA